MSEILESMVGRYLTCNGEAFVCSQFEVAYDPKLKQGGASVDFVALDFKRKDLVVIEVSSASSIKSLLSKVEQRHDRWFKPIYATLLESAAISNAWRPRFLGLIRSDLISGARLHFQSNADVAFEALENIAFDWVYWEQRRTGLPGADVFFQSSSEEDYR